VALRQATRRQRILAGVALPRLLDELLATLATETANATHAIAETILFVEELEKFSLPITTEEEDQPR
jgi:hypothetical protein